MQIVLPEIMAEVRELTVWLTVLAFAVGLFLGLAGWWSYRFWAVLLTTVSAGMYGLMQSESLNLMPVVAALLLAVSAGVLALSLMRIAAFFLGGLGCLVLVRLLAPGADAPAICILSGGVLAILLFRLWIMLLSAFAGSVVVSYCFLCFFDRLGTFDSVQWCLENELLLNWLCLAGTVLGAGFQFFWTREAKNEKKEPGSKGGDKKSGGGSKGLPLKWLIYPFGKAA